MFDQRALRDELQSLRVDLSRLRNAIGEEGLQGSKSRVDALADQIRAALGNIGEVLGQENGQLQKLLSDRPIASLASAFTLGVVVGIALRRH